MIEVRWHARAGQGAKSASQLLATAALQAGRSVQAFPEYGPERRGAPVRAYTRIDDRSIRRHDSVTEPDAVVVLEPSLLSTAVVEGLRRDGLLVVDSDRPESEIRNATGWEGRLLCVDGSGLARVRGLKFANVVVLGALAAALGEPPLEELLAAAERLLGRKGGDVGAGVADGYRSVSAEVVA